VFTRPAQAVLGHALQHTLLMMQFLMTRPQSMQRGRYVVARARRMKMSLAAFKEHSKESGVRPADAPRTLPLPPPLARASLASGGRGEAGRAAEAMRRL
jgi:hypothetical protein